MSMVYWIDTQQSLKDTKKQINITNLYGPNEKVLISISFKIENISADEYNYQF